MEAIYFDPRAPGSFGGQANLAKYSGRSMPSVRRFLENREAYTLHKDIRHKFRRRKTFVVGSQHLYQLDLMDMQMLAKYNAGNKYILTCIDAFSRKAWAVAVPSKSAHHVKTAFEDILSRSHTRPIYVQTDKGTEFVNSIFIQYLKENNITHYTTDNYETKASIVERFNKTLKSKLWRYFTYKNTYDYISVLPDILTSYNNTYHRSIKMAPNQVNEDNRMKVFETLYPDRQMASSRKKIKFRKGDYVRIQETRKIFQKGYHGHWTREIFLIKAVLPTEPPTYEIEDLMSEAIQGKFYAEELQKIAKPDDIYRVEKILKTRRRAGKTEYLVRYQGYPPKFDSWTGDISRL